MLTGKSNAEINSALMIKKDLHLFESKISNYNNLIGFSYQNTSYILLKLS